MGAPLQFGSSCLMEEGSVNLCSSAPERLSHEWGQIEAVVPLQTTRLILA